jgi:hypothetical protein
MRGHASPPAMLHRYESRNRYTFSTQDKRRAMQGPEAAPRHPPGPQAPRRHHDGGQTRNGRSRNGGGVCRHEAPFEMGLSCAPPIRVLRTSASPPAWARYMTSADPAAEHAAALPTPPPPWTPAAIAAAAGNEACCSATQAASAPAAPAAPTPPPAQSLSSTNWTVARRWHAFWRGVIWECGCSWGDWHALACALFLPFSWPRRGAPWEG